MDTGFALLHHPRPCLVRTTMSTIRTVADLFLSAASQYRDRPMLRGKKHGAWQSETFEQWLTQAQAWAAGLVALGLQPGERVAILARTSPLWVKADMAIALAGGVSVPIFPNLPDNEIAFIAADSDARYAFCEDPPLLASLVRSRPELPALAHVVCLRDQVSGEKDADAPRRMEDVLPATDGWAMSITTLVSAGRLLPSDTLSNRRASVSADDPCTFVYTSGTTGRQKGVVLSHKAVVFEVHTLVESLDLRDDDTVLLFLPLAHIFERIVCLVCMFRGVQLVFPTSLDALFTELKETRPSVIPSVPRVFETVRNSAIARAEKAGKLGRQTFEWAVAIGEKVAAKKRRGSLIPLGLRAQHLLARRLVLDGIPRRLGGNVRYCISGGAPLAPDVARFFDALGLPILEGYGLTECTAAATLGNLREHRPGTVGRALAGTQIRIAQDGEVLIAGPHLMTGYHKRAEDSAVALGDDGWLRTGDLGELTEDGELRITGRKKDLIVTTTGKNVAPQHVEQHLKQHPLLSQAVVYGDGRDFLTALLTLDEAQLRRWAAEQGVTYTSYSQMSQRPDVYKLAQAAVEQRNRSLASYETIKKFAVLDEPMSAAAGDLTPTLKVRRNVLMQKYRTLLDSFYRDSY